MRQKISFPGYFPRYARLPLVGFLVLIAGLLSSCSEEVLSGLNQRDALDAQVVLERSGIAVSVTGEKNGTFTLSTESEDHTRAIELLTNAGLPRTQHASVAEVFPGGGFLVTPFEQKARMNYALEEQLSETLAALDGVAEARVHVVLAEENGRGLIKERARASALLKYRSGADLAGIETKSRALLVNSIRGLSYEDVSIVATPWAEPGVSQDVVAVPADVVAKSASFVARLQEGLNNRTLIVALAIMLAIVAAVLLLMPQRKES